MSVKIRVSEGNASKLPQKIKKNGYLRKVSKFGHSLPETELTNHCQKVMPKFGRTSVDPYLLGKFEVRICTNF